MDSQLIYWRKSAKLAIADASTTGFNKSWVPIEAGKKYYLVVG